MRPDKYDKDFCDKFRWGFQDEMQGQYDWHLCDIWPSYQDGVDYARKMKKENYK